jgi:hypothetical protein
MNNQENQQENQENNEDTEVLDFNKPDYTFIPKGSHNWKQQGYYLVCKSCEIQHATWVGANKLMVGLDKKGMPILKKRKELGMA